MTQGDSSIDDYCLRIKTTTDKLHDVGHPVDEAQLVLNLLRGLNEQYSGTGDHIAATSLTLTYARDQLSIKELRLANGKKVAAATALVASCDVTPAFLAPNKPPNKSRVFPNFPAELNFSLRNPGHLLPLSPSARVPRIPPAPPALGPSPTRAAPAPRSATAPGILRTPRSRRRSASPSPPSRN
jgi:hypothetical protein